ncbi:probable G-protein coupled receptor 19 [Suricata suricatta]|uniref:probable G-protein coupled receptor 19 n=1 Tax=Suricata suricatta TaxID=37032 RepID=UPI001155FF48|nr:probable G-protein coupled receptor 19 [Suricata suricatta]
MVFAHKMDESKPPLVIPTLLVPLQNHSCTETATPLPSRDLTGLRGEHGWKSNRTDLRYGLRPGEVATASIFFGALWLFSVFGNSLVCLVIHRSRRTQSTTNYFVVSMACADLLVSVASTPFVLLQFATGRWTLGSVMCKFVRYFQYLTPGVQIYVLLSICIDRFYTIVYPLSFKVSREKAKKMIATSWVFNAAFVTPVFFFYGPNWDNHCNYFLPASWEGTAYTVIHFLVSFVIPSVLIILFYQKVVKYIWRIGTDGRTVRRTMNIVPRTKVKTIKMFLILNLLFLLSCFSRGAYPQSWSWSSSSNTSWLLLHSEFEKGAARLEGKRARLCLPYLANDSAPTYLVASPLGNVVLPEQGTLAQGIGARHLE